MSQILLVRSAAVAAAYATAYLVPGTTVAATAAATVKALNFILLGHYLIFAVRVSSRVVMSAHIPALALLRQTPRIGTARARAASLSLR